MTGIARLLIAAAACALPEVARVPMTIYSGLLTAAAWSARTVAS